jgi:hypothetical protein
MVDKPTPKSSLAERELDKAEAQFKAFDDNVKDLTTDRMNQAPLRETELQVSQKDLEKSKEIYLKPVRALGPGVNPKTGEKEKFNERFRKDFEFQSEMVNFIAYNKEIGGEAIEIWTKPFPGVNCELWKVPVNVSVWGPRHLAEQITRCRYHILKMDQAQMTHGSANTQFYGQIIADETVQRLDAKPVIRQKSIFMGANSF